MPSKAERHREYMRNRYQSDPEFRKRQILAVAETRRRNVEWFQEFRSKLKCVRCGESHPATLDFHHRDPTEKEKRISVAMRSWSRSRLLNEVEKCEVLCSNCHRKEHWKRRSGVV